MLLPASPTSVPLMHPAAVPLQAAALPSRKRPLEQPSDLADLLAAVDNDPAARSRMLECRMYILGGAPDNAPPQPKRTAVESPEPTGDCLPRGIIAIAVTITST